MHTMTVEQVLQLKASDELISVPASASVADAVEVMAARHVGAVVIKTEDGLVGGIFTERDLLKRVVHEGRDPQVDADLAGHDARRALRHAGHDASKPR